jgi:DnaJ-class molecular chaperone
LGRRSSCVAFHKFGFATRERLVGQASCLSPSERRARRLSHQGSEFGAELMTLTIQGQKMPALTTEKTGTEEVTCAFCGGTGKDPFGILSWLSTCCVCGGRGVVRVRTPCARCAHCGGTGAVKTLTCTVCMGTGHVSLPMEPTTTCPECRGSGDDLSAPAMACLKCRGRGFIVAT